LFHLNDGTEHFLVAAPLRGERTPEQSFGYGDWFVQGRHIPSNNLYQCRGPWPRLGIKEGASAMHAFGCEKCETKRYDELDCDHRPDPGRPNQSDSWIARLNASTPGERRGDRPAH